MICTILSTLPKISQNYLFWITHMDFTQYSQLLSYTQSAPSRTVLDVMGQTLPSSSETIIHLGSDIQSIPADSQFDVILCRLAVCIQDDHYHYLSDMMQMLKPQGMLIIQDYVMPDEKELANYLNGFIHIFNKKHVKSFAQYAWNGLLLDLGLNIQAYHQGTIKMTIQQWIEYHQPSKLDIQHAQVMLLQAPDAVVNTMQLHYAGTVYAEFELQEIVCVAQKGTNG